MHFVEQLEPRTLLAGGPDVYEQYLICLINRARANPVAEAARYHVGLNEGVPTDELISSAPKPPLAINPNLQQSAQDHAQWMIDTDTYSHSGVNGSTPDERDRLAGYVFTPPAAWAENIAFSGQLTTLPDVMAAMDRLHLNLFVDTGVNGRTHRTTMLQQSLREVGVGLVSGDLSTDSGVIKAWMLSQDLAYRTGNNFITGVIFADTMKKDGFYTPYEGFGQVSVTATSSTGTAYQTTSWDSGGYSLEVPAGTYRLVFSGGDLPAPVVRENVIVGTANVLQDVNATGTPGVPTRSYLGKLLVNGTAGDDHITVENLVERVRVTVNDSTWDLPRKSVKRIEVHGGTGNDMIDIGPGLPSSRLYGDDGNDSISGGEGNDRIYGGAGNDTIIGGVGNDRLYGDDGDDRLDGQDGNDAVIGGLGADTLIGSLGLNFLKARDATADTIVIGVGRDTISQDKLLDIRTTLVV